MRAGHVVTIGLLLISVAGFAPAFADSNSERIDQLQQQVQMMQRQLYRGGEGSNVAASGGGMGSASVEAGLDQTEEEIRQLRGQVEENKHAIEQLTRQLSLQQEDTQYRLEQLEKGGTPGAPSPAGTVPSPMTSASATVTGTLGATAAPAELSGATAATPSDAKGLYNHAIGQMNKTDYDGAAQSFNLFIQRFPKDPLIGNAYYWLGETYYVRANYPKAVDEFRQGFEALPNGIKAPDNLLKLSMALARMNKTREACVVLKQIQVKYASSPQNVTGAAQAEAQQLKCQ